ncbi:unnamed protein product [Phytophthora lilii]|uniref:RxLR effector protein n=1 Tax=Phytophthora lilii TaxID=2077276 RepID=A0A9W6TPS5_9STRA|nr:unnamed protein product [Phytophthora lilii]
MRLSYVFLVATVATLLAGGGTVTASVEVSAMASPDHMVSQGLVQEEKRLLRAHPTVDEDGNEDYKNKEEKEEDDEGLFPSRPLLRVKRTWRCVESIERGTAGILVKPQISPMSGDSSLPVSASWFKKANLAAQYVPVVTFQRLPYRGDNGGSIECVLLVENPLDDAIRITFRAPTASEPREEYTENGQIVFQDSTPIIVGPYEDPNLADAFIDDEPPFGANGDQHSSILVQATRNLIKVKFPLVINDTTSSSPSTISARFIMDTEKFDEDANEVIENSLLSVPVVITAPVPQ